MLEHNKHKHSLTWIPIAASNWFSIATNDEIEFLFVVHFGGSLHTHKIRSTFTSSIYYYLCFSNILDDGISIK